MRTQASIEAIVSVLAVLGVVTVGVFVFTGNRDELGSYEEYMGARQVCYQIRNVLIDVLEPGKTVKVEVPYRLNHEYTLHFINDSLDLSTEGGFACTLPSSVYDAYNRTDFVMNPGTLVFSNIYGRIYSQNPIITTPPLSDYDQWQLFFDPNSDFNYKSTGSWTIKVWLYDQHPSPLPGRTLNIIINRIGSASILSGAMTGNGDGSYSWTGSIPGPWNNDWASINIVATDPSINRNLLYQRVVWVKGSAGATDRPWKIELDPGSNVTFLQASTNNDVKIWLYNAGGAPMPGEAITLSLIMSDTGSVIVASPMADNGDGSYTSTIPANNMTAGVDYRIQTASIKIISGDVYMVMHGYLVEAVS